MSTITPLIPAGPGLSPDFVAPLTGTSEAAPPAGPSYTPLWLVGTGASSNAFEMLGIRTPSANGDVAALLAEASFNLELTVEETKKSRAAFALAALAGAMAQQETALIRDANVKQLALEQSREALDTVNARTAQPKSDRAVLTAQINGYRQQIATLEMQIAATPPGNPLHPALLAQLAHVRSQLSAALAEREPIDLELAAARIDSLVRQVADLELVLQELEPGSEQAEEVGALLEAKRDALAAARTQVEDFEAGPKTDATRTAFSDANFNALMADTQELTTRTAGYQEAFNEVAEALREAAEYMQAVRAQLAAAFQMLQSAQVGEDAYRDMAVERFFETLVQEFADFGSRELGELQALDKRDADSVAVMHNERLRALANGLVGVLADLVLTLSRLEASAPPSNLPPPTIASRVRLDV